MKRYAVVAGLFVMMLITYIDRAAISSAALAMSSDLGLLPQQMGTVFGAFALGYAIAQIPGGWLADRFGPRIALAAVVLVWSVFTGATGLARGFAFLLLMRFLFGVAEAGAFPGAARVVFNWLPETERGRANGVIFCGSRLGAALAFPMMAVILARWDWRTAFFLLALPGVVWSVLWLLFFRDHPAPVDKSPRAVERAAPGAFAAIVRSPAMLLAMAQYFAGNFTFFVCLSWMLPYLRQRYSLGESEAAAYATVPLLTGAMAHFISGFTVDALYKSRARAWSRRLPALAGFVIAACGMVMLAYADSAQTAIAAFTLAAFGAEATIAPSWAFCLDVGGRHSGAVSGSMNMIGNAGSFVSANAFPFLQTLTGSAAAYFAIAALLNSIAAICWIWMRSCSALPEERRPAV